MFYNKGVHSHMVGVDIFWIIKAEVKPIPHKGITINSFRLLLGFDLFTHGNMVKRRSPQGIRIVTTTMRRVFPNLPFLSRGGFPLYNESMFFLIMAVVYIGVQFGNGTKLQNFSIRPT